MGNVSKAIIRKTWDCFAQEPAIKQYLDLYRAKIQRTDLEHIVLA